MIIANNVMAHVPDLNGFVAGMAHLLADDGVITVENPYVRDLIEHCEFDTIYHEHVFYYSCTSVDHLMRRHGLCLNHVEYFPDLHGGTLRWHIGHTEHRSDEVMKYLADEAATASTPSSTTTPLPSRFSRNKDELLALLEGLHPKGSASPPTAPPPRGAPCSTTVGSEPTWSSSWSTATSTSRDCSCRAPISRSDPGGFALRAARLRAAARLELPR